MIRIMPFCRVFDIRSMLDKLVVKIAVSDKKKICSPVQEFWKDGPKILSSWFQWISDGSEEDSLSTTLTRQTVKVGYERNQVNQEPTRNQEVLNFL